MSTEEPFSPNFKPGPGVVVAGKVQLERLLARGGMGSVWVGKHLGLDIAVAVKFMSTTTDQSMSRFRREARTAAKIKSSNIVRILDYGVDQETPYIVMELLEGENLGARIKRVGYVSLIEAERIMVPVARALERAHEAHLVHRDLKPDNIFLAREGDEEIPKILDFGIVKSLAGSSLSNRESTEGGAVIGTLHYMSPEQARGQGDVDHRSDVWSWAVILYRMLTGKRPFNATGFGKIIMQICSEPHLNATSYIPGLPAEIDAFFDRALAKDPADRFSSMKEMAQAYTAIVKKFVPRPEPSTRFSASIATTATTLDSADLPTLVRQPSPAVTNPPASATPLPSENPPAITNPPMMMAPPAMENPQPPSSVSITVEPWNEPPTMLHAPSRKASFVAITVAIVTTLALGLVATLWITSSPSEDPAQGSASATPEGSLALAATAPAPIATNSTTAPAASSAMTKSSAAPTAPAGKPIRTKTTDSTKKKNRDFGY